MTGGICPRSPSSPMPAARRIIPSSIPCWPFGRCRGSRRGAVTKVDAKLGQTVGPIATRRHPEKGLEGKFSYQHGMSVALVFGNAYPQQFTDAKVNDPTIKGLRDRIEVIEDRSLPRRTAVVTMTLEDGRSYTVRTDHSAGTLGNPMTARSNRSQVPHACP